jgi:prophage regulatory protein
MTEKILRLPEVKKQTGQGRSTIYAGVAAGTFPSPILIGARSVGWLETEISDWISSRIQASRKGVSNAAL